MDAICRPNRAYFGSALCALDAPEARQPQWLRDDAFYSQIDTRRLHRWLEHGSKAHLQRILSGRFAGASRQAHAKAASTSSLVGGEELFRGDLAMRCSSVEQSGQNDARRLYRWLEHGSKAHLQQALSSRKPR